MLRERVLRAVARLWWLRIYAGSGDVPVPKDDPSIRSGAADPDRVLVLGNGAAGGWGVLTHRLALGGLLAAALERRSGRGCDVDLLGDEVMNAGSAPAWIGDRRLDGYDVVVIVLGMNDALRRSPVLRWRAEMELLLFRLVPCLHPGAEVLVTGIEPIAFALPFRGPLGRLAQRHAHRLNDATREVVAATERTEYVELRAAAPPRVMTEARPVYEQWAEQLADRVAPAIARSRARHGRPGRPVEDAVRGPLPMTDGLDGLQALVDQAKDDLDADFAWVGLLDGDRQAIPVTTASRSPASVPWDLTFCRVTVAQDDTFVVPDAQADRRFAGNPFLDVLHLEAYAGHPLRDRDGTPIGTFCVATIRPTGTFGAAGPALRSFARRAEAELARRGGAAG